MKVRVREFAFLLVWCVAGVAVAGPQAVPTPVPGKLPFTVGRTPGMPPQLPVVPLTEEKIEKLSPEERARLEHFRKNQLPPDATFQDFVEYWMTPRPYPKNTVVFLEGGKLANPHPAVPWIMEVVKVEGDTVWLRSLPPEDPRSPIHKLWLLYQMEEAAEKARMEDLIPAYYLDFENPPAPPPFVETIKFRRAGKGLPAEGRWQMNFALADFNGDGKLDVLTPPPRKGGIKTPLIFLGDGKGDFSLWKDVRWSDEPSYDYGGVCVGDFDRDGNLDVALAMHFKSQWVLYGDGKGNFTKAVELPSPDPRQTARACAVGDVDGDGDLDIAFISELGMDLGTSQPLGVPNVWVVRNDGDKWALIDEGLPRHPMGDDIELADVSGDGYPDVVIASNLNSWRALVYVNGGKKGFRYLPFDGVLADAYHFDVELAQLDNDGLPELVAAMEEFANLGGKNQARTGVVWYDITKGGIPKPVHVVALDDEATNPYWRVAVGDFNGDGLADLVAAKKDGPIHVFLRKGNGFVREESPELKVEGRIFGLEAVDINGDGLDDVVVGFAKRGDLPGGLAVWLAERG